LDLIRRNGKNLLRLVNQLLDLSRLESGSMTVEYQQGDIMSFLEYLLESFRSLADRKRLNIHFRAPVDRLLMDFDPEKIQTIVVNLLSNAVKFTPEGGEVGLSAEEISQDGRPYLSLQVNDDGPGIPPEHLPHIFDRFYQADTSSTREAEGSGIGLTLVRELVELLSGSITVQSEEGKGTQFVVLLPITRQARVPEETPSLEVVGSSEDLSGLAGFPDATERSGKWPIVLIVEDNPDVIRYLRSILEERYQIETAANGRLGLEKAIEVIPDLIISDVMMPEMDGYELCDR
ncbi:MAG: hybrid sensor histidine kinase/response regulator, partial [Saprospiraceae bacterium]|nr:hybrid sensor histidine kinase/response regulator [Saprospiraceae bacterium]